MNRVMQRNRRHRRRTPKDAHSVATAAVISRLIELAPDIVRDREELARVTPAAEINRAMETLSTWRQLTSLPKGQKP